MALNETLNTTGDPITRAMRSVMGQQPALNETPEQGMQRRISRGITAEEQLPSLMDTAASSRLDFLSERSLFQVDPDNVRDTDFCFTPVKLGSLPIRVNLTTPSVPGDGVEQMLLVKVSVTINGFK